MNEIIMAFQGEMVLKGAKDRGVAAVARTFSGSTPNALPKLAAYHPQTPVLQKEGGAA